MNRQLAVSIVLVVLVLISVVLVAAGIGYRMNPAHQPTQVTIRLTCISTAPALVTCKSAIE